MPRRAKQPHVHGRLAPGEWAQLFAEEAASLGYKITPRELAEGIGVVFAESGGNASSRPAGNEHIGGLAESTAFGSEAERLNARRAVRAALVKWKEDGKSWWPAWGVWEKGETEGPGPDRYKRYLRIAEEALSGHGFAPPQRSPGPSENSSSSPGGLAGDLMHFGLVAALVLGGVGLIGLGGARMLGSSSAGKALE